MLESFRDEDSGNVLNIPIQIQVDTENPLINFAEVRDSFFSESRSTKTGTLAKSVIKPVPGEISFGLWGALLCISQFL